MTLRPTRVARAAALLLPVLVATATPALAGPEPVVDGAESVTDTDVDVALEALEELTTSVGANPETAPADAAAPAHEGHGVLVIEGRHPTGPDDVHYVVRLTWSGDGHPADPATTALTATVVGPAGPLAPVVFTPYDGDGRYAANVSFPGPGVWTLRFDAPSPQTTFESLELVPVVGVPLTFA